MIDLANERTRHSLVGGSVQRRRRHSSLLLPKISYKTVKTRPAHVQRKKLLTFAKSEVCEVPDKGLQLTLPAKKCSGKNNIEMENEAHIST